jgi:hypothetical protein
VKNLKANNGKVGVFGISYPGFYATMAALSGHSAVKAVSPQAPVTDWYMGDDFHHNGAFMLQDAFGFYSGFCLWILVLVFLSLRFICCPKCIGRFCHVTRAA